MRMNNIEVQFRAVIGTIACTSPHGEYKCASFCYTNFHLSLRFKYLYSGNTKSFLIELFQESVKIIGAAF